MAIIAVTVLVGGWWLSLDALARMRPKYVSMLPSTALSLLVLGGAMLWRLAVEKTGGRARILLNTLAAIVVLIAAGDLVLILTGTAGSIDALIPAHSLGSAAIKAPAAAISLLLGVACLFTIDCGSRGERVVFVWCATGGLLAAMSAVVGYLFDAAALSAVSVFTAMALGTGVAFLLLFAALLLMRSDTGWVGVLLASEVGSAGARRLLPLLVATPLTLCFAALLLTDAGILTANFRLSLAAVAMVAALVASAVWTAGTVNARERDLIRTTQQLWSTLRQRDHLLQEINHRVRNNLQQINSLLQLEASRMADTGATNALRATIRRVTALGAVHRLLLSSDVPSRVPADVFLKDVASNVTSYLRPEIGQLTIETESDDLTIPVDLAAVLGLLVNELVTRTVQSPPPSGWYGSLRLKLVTRTANELVMTLVHAGDGEASLRQHRVGGATSDRIIYGLIGQLDATVTPIGHEGMAGVEIAIPTGRYIEDGDR